MSSISCHTAPALEILSSAPTTTVPVTRFAVEQVSRLALVIVVAVVVIAMVAALTPGPSPPEEPGPPSPRMSSCTLPEASHLISVSLVTSPVSVVVK